MRRHRLGVKVACIRCPFREHPRHHRRRVERRGAGRQSWTDLVDTGHVQNADAVLAPLRQLTNRPVRHIINTHSHADHVGGNESWRVGRADIRSRRCGSGCRHRCPCGDHRARETLNRMSAPAGSQAPTPVTAWPTSTFSGKHKEFYYNGEGVQIVHFPSAHTDGDSVVFFRRSDVIATGDVSRPSVIRSSMYSSEAASRASSMASISYWISSSREKRRRGGTMLIPGHGRISDEADLVMPRHDDHHPRSRAGHGQPRV